MASYLKNSIKALMNIKWSLMASCIQKQNEGIDGRMVLHGILCTEAGIRTFMKVTPMCINGKVVLHGILLKKQY